MSEKFAALAKAITEQAADIRVVKVGAGSSKDAAKNGLLLVKGGLEWCCLQNAVTGEVQVFDGSTLVYSLDMTADGVEFTANKIVRDFSYECVSVTEKLRPSKEV